MDMPGIKGSRQRGHKAETEILAAQNNISDSILELFFTIRSETSFLLQFLHTISKGKREIAQRQ